MFDCVYFGWKLPEKLPEVTGEFPGFLSFGLGRVTLTKLLYAILPVGSCLVSPISTNILPCRLLYVGR